MPNWGEVLTEINQFRAAHAAASKQAVDQIRRNYLQALHKHTERNIIAYYSGYLSKPEIPSEINDEDKNGFKGKPGASDKAKRIVRQLTDYRKNKTHERHISAEECVAMGLVIEKVEDDQKLQDILLTVHHCYMHSLMNTNSYKMVENHLGVAFVKQQGPVVVPVQQ